MWQAKLACKDRALASSRKAFLADVLAMETSWLNSLLQRGPLL